MSRLIVKNLPPYVTVDRLKEHFSQSGRPSGIITDVKVPLKKDTNTSFTSGSGSSTRSRGFGFVGYKTDAEAQAARKWFNGTFIGMTRISVDIVEGTKDAPAPRPNKRRRIGPAPGDAGPSDEVVDGRVGPERGGVKCSKSEKKNASAILEGHTTTKSKPELKSKSGKSSQVDEFVEVMKTRASKGPSWLDGPRVDPSLPPPDEDQQEEGDATANNPEVSDLDWMRRHMKQDVDKVERAFEQSDSEEEDHSGNRKQPEAAEQVEVEADTPDPAKETILQTSRLFVRNLTFSCTEEELQALFSRYGDVQQVHIPLDPVTHQPKGLAYITFTRATDAVAAYEALDKTSFQGRLLHILPAVDRFPQPNASTGDERKKTVKGEKNAKRRAVAGKEFNWGMLYMNSDAVASSIATRMNISKSDILNPDGGQTEEGSTNPAVRLALAETHIINETKAYLESQGVSLASFSDLAQTPSSAGGGGGNRGRVVRSETTILVKNIPFGTSAEQIRELFEPHGTVNRVIVPPAGTLAVVEYNRADEARRGFGAVAYRRLGNSIVYLEKAPVGVFAGRPRAGSKEEDRTPSASASVVRVEDTDAHDTNANASTDLTAGTTLYVKNLSFSTTPERLTQTFSHLPSFAFARIQTKPDPVNPNSGRRLSMGYGFIGFKDVDGAKGGLKRVDGYVLDGHALVAKFAGRGGGEGEGVGKGTKSKSRTTKMVVKNVPFEASKKDIRDLFSAHGHLKSLRLPKKFNSHTRGFAFLEFVSRTEAENAFNALRHTHLLGRHLVLEWADEEGEVDLDVLRRKAGVGYGDGKEVPGRKRKLELDLNLGGEGEGEDEE